MSTPDACSLDELAHVIAAHGIERYEPRVLRLVDELRSTGHGGLLTDLLEDRNLSPIVRARAFGLILAGLDGLKSWSPRTVGADQSPDGQSADERRPAA